MEEDAQTLQSKHSGVINQHLCSCAVVRDTAEYTSRMSTRVDAIGKTEGQGKRNACQARSIKRSSTRPSHSTI